jgi:hypothetical protein
LAEALATGKRTTLEVPPPGLDTVMEPVVGAAILAAGTLAVSLLGLRYLVASAFPFQFTTELETNPVPLTVSVKLAPLGATAVGLKGCAMNGTGGPRITEMLGEVAVTASPTVSLAVIV